ncbi:MAG: malate synthase G, partial [Novosphingobium sp.]|nr:malate synthase G [Novosphingobium sp.]
MTDRVARAGLQVEAGLARFIDNSVLAPLGMNADSFWTGFAAICDKFVPRNRELLAKRDAIQAQMDAWHKERAGQPHDAEAYKAFLTEIGYLVPEPGDFAVGTQNVDPEIATMAGPQLVVPVLNDRFALNAANARWGSLYDAFYGTDALDAPAAKPGGYDPERGAAVIARAKAFLDEAVPLANGSWADLADVSGGIALKDESQYLGQSEKGRLFVNNGLHIEVVFDKAHPIGKDDPAGIADVLLESALTTIIDLEDSVA